MESSITQWKTQFLVNDERLKDVNIKKRIFQGDSLSPLLIVFALICLSTILKKSDHGYQTSKISARLSTYFRYNLKLYRKKYADKILQWNLDKCTTTNKESETEGIKIPNENNIKSSLQMPGHPSSFILKSKR